MITKQVIYILLHLIFFSPTFSEKPSVIIVGAGVSGIAAAAKLLEKSITNITILEAENRIGGRIHSVKFGNGFVDLGAQICQGQDGNIVYELVEDLDVLQPAKVANPANQKLYCSDGKKVVPEVAQELKNAIGSVSNIATTVNLKETILENYNSSIRQKYENDQLAEDGLKLIDELVLRKEKDFVWRDPLKGGHFRDSPGQYMNWKKIGYSLILDILMKSYPNSEKKLPIDDKIIMNKQVTKIIWNNNKVEVKSNDASWKADYVIFTPSIGVLKAQETMFKPQLPTQKKEALNALGFNGIMKIILNFPEKWWKDEDASFLFLWRNDDFKRIREEFSDGPDKNDIPWVVYISGLTQISTNPNALTAWLGGELLPEIEKASEEVIKKGCMYVLRKFLGKNYNITDPDKIIRSQWNINSNFLGTFSYEKPEYYNESISFHSKLSEPLLNEEGRPKVLFAGEATHPTQFSTVHGAIGTGVREAERIIKWSM